VVRLRSRPARPSDEGFTLVEVMVSIAVMGVVMTALTAFFTNSLSITNYQRGRQAAVQVVDDAMELVRSLRGSGIATGRDKQSSDEQWDSPVAGVARFLTDSREAWDTAAVYPLGYTAALPTKPLVTTVSGVTYEQNFYVGQCWQPVSGGGCAALPVDSYIEMYRVIVAVTWTEKHCPGNACTMVTGTLISGAGDEPIFNSNAVAAPPTVTNPGAQIGEVDVPTALQMVAAGGAPPLIWSATGLPVGLSMSSGGLLGGKPTTPGTYTVTVSGTDDLKLVGKAVFTWTVNAVPSLTNPGAKTSPVGNPVTLTLARTGGTAPFTWTASATSAWSATGLPTGLSLNPTTGVVTGTPTTPGSGTVTVAVKDKFAKTASVAFTWTVIPRPTITPLATQNSAVGNTISLQAAATGGTGAYRWSATGLPTGLSISNGGLISGTVAAGTRFRPTITVTDALLAPHSVTFVWNVTSTTMSITAPATDRTGDVAGATVSIPLTASGGTAPYTWVPTGLPPGIALSGGALTGTVSAAGTYTVTVTATDSSPTIHKVATMVFTWEIR
jgi:prepilin-type N-terminal cleavage/methylation domain-containing protein